MRISKENYKAWVTQLDRDIVDINAVTYDPILNLGDKFELGFRGKYHCVCLIKNGETIACGIREITDAIVRYKKRYNV